MIVPGVDIAGSYQAGFSVASAKAAGCKFVVAKISEGTTNGGVNWDNVNWSWAQTWLNNARDLGITPGGYHALRNGNGAAQAELFYSRVSRWLDGPFLVQLDNEFDADWATTQAWAARWEQLSGGKPWAMYSGAWWWGPRGWNGASLTPYLWHSRYLWDSSTNLAMAGTPSQLYPLVAASWWTPGYGNWSRASILQYTSRGTIGGITANVDLNGVDDAVLSTLAGGDVNLDDPLDPYRTVRLALTEIHQATWSLLNDSQTGVAVRMQDVQQKMSDPQSGIAARLQDVQQKVTALSTGGVSVPALVQALVPALLQPLVNALIQPLTAALTTALAPAVAEAGANEIAQRMQD